jgi:microcystin-dependent protein
MINPYVGEVTAFGFKFAPAGWIQCQGQLLSVQEYNQLFSVVGTVFGGDGLATFGLPNFGTMTADGGLMCISAFGAAPTSGRNALPGEMTIFAYQYEPPSGWIECGGDVLPIAQNASLFKILGTTFGGNGTTTFALPDTRWVPPFGPGAPPLLYSIAKAPSEPPPEGYEGEIKIFPSTVPPKGWLPCDGRLLTISDNTALFSLLQTTYGGDGKTTFGLPNIEMPGTAPAGLQAFICQLGVFPQGP